MSVHTDQPNFTMRERIPKPLTMKSCPNPECDAEGRHLVNAVDNGTTTAFDCAECGKFLGEDVIGAEP